MNLKRIPTILALLILTVAVGVTVVATQRFQGLISKAAVGSTPKNIRITNITDTSFTVSYLTDAVVKGSAGVAGQVFFPDDRDLALDQSKAYNTHHVTVKNLSAGTKYNYQVENGTTTYEITTAPKITVSATAAEPIYGTASKADGTPAYGAIVYFSPFGGAPVSTIVKTNGNFLLPVNNIRTADLRSFLQLKNNDPETIFIEGGTDRVSIVSCSVGKDKPVPNIVLGKDTNCTSAAAVAITSPYEGEKVLIGQPTFRGTAPAGTMIQLETMGEVKTDTAGKWLWVISTNLEPGSHVLTISYLDSTGTTKKLVRNFTVQAAGTSILPLTTGTPSAVIKKPIIAPIITPIPIKTKPPVTGATENMFLLLTAGSFLVTLGLSTIYKALWIR